MKKMFKLRTMILAMEIGMCVAVMTELNVLLGLMFMMVFVEQYVIFRGFEKILEGHVGIAEAMVVIDTDLTKLTTRVLCENEDKNE